VSQYDVNTFGISLTGQAISSYLNAGGSTIQGISNLNLRAIQEHALNFAHITWTPADARLRGFCQAKFRAKQECAQLSDDNIKVRNTFEQWAKEWHTKPCNTHAYHLSLLQPPDRHNHPLRFKKNFEPLNVICECSYDKCTLAHIIFDCPLFSRVCKDAQIDNRCVQPSMWDLFASLDSACQLYKFLDHITPAHKLLGPPWLPGVPRLDPATDRWYWDDSIT
ncbi:hypothetical protein EI94DRAFT_1727413, partial [Lactarius quietus]